MKKIILIFCLFLFQKSMAQIIDSTINKLPDTIAQIEKNERILKPFSGNYIFITKVSGKNEKIYTREVNVYLVDIKEETATYLLYCVKYDFKDPEFQSFLKKIAYLFDEILVSVNREGKIICMEEKNKNLLKKRWQETRAKILETNSGKVLLDYLQTIDKMINNDNSLFDFLQTDKMYGMLFNGMTNYESQAKKNKNKNSLETIEPKTKFPITDEQYTYQNAVLITGKKKETQRNKENTIIEYEILYNGKEKWTKD